MRTFRNLNEDEALVLDQIDNYKIDKRIKGFEYTTFIPSNPRQKDIDLLYAKGDQFYSIQVKGSRVYDIKKSFHKEKFGNETVGWVTVPTRTIKSSICDVDYFIFVIHTIGNNKRRVKIIPQFLIVPIDDMTQIIKDKRESSEKYHFYFYFNLPEKKVYEIRDYTDDSQQPINFYKYWNKWSLL